MVFYDGRGGFKFIFGIFKILNKSYVMELLYKVVNILKYTKEGD